MHPSVIEFRDHFFSYCDAPAIPLPALREELLYLHHTVEDEASRIELMRIFNVIADLAESFLSREGKDLAGFRMHRQGQIWMFLSAESLVEGVIDREKLLYVTRRELAAGRMNETDELHRYALGNDAAFDTHFTSH